MRVVGLSLCAAVPMSIAMAIQMICPNVRCGHIHSFPDEARGQVIKCLRCEMQFRIPSPQRKPTETKTATVPVEFLRASVPTL